MALALAFAKCWYMKLSNLPPSRSTMHFTRRLLILFVTSCAVAAASSLSAQNLTPEFIESSSPLPNGGRVITRSSPGGAIQTVTTESTTSVGSSRSVLDRGVNSVLNRENESSGSSNDSTTSEDRDSLFRQPIAGSDAANVSNQQQSSIRYPYPAGNRVAANPNQNLNFRNAIAGNTSANRVAQTGLLHDPVRASVGCTNCQIPYQINTLGLSNTTTNTTTAQRPQQRVFVPPSQQCCGQNIYNAASSLQVPAFQQSAFQQQPVLQLQQPVAAAQVPSLSLQNPNLGAQFNTGLQQTGVLGTGTGFGFQPQQNRWWTPFVTGSGVYQPIVRLANLQPGTYLGQGIIGQPTAYVDGQPVRNLFRYVLP